jgi:DNA polymerase
MQRVTLHDPISLDEFRTAARGLIAAHIAPAAVFWETGSARELFGNADIPCGTAAFTVPAAYVPLAEAVLCHTDAERHALLYEALWRITHGERELLDVASDPLVHRLRLMEKAVRRDTHKMTAFVRFRQMVTDGEEHYVAWFEPAHHILRRGARFFVDRFAAMRWSILTPEASLHWDGKELTFGGGVSRSQQPREDALEDWWKSYYRATFNPARANPSMMRQEMPKKYWRNLPEAALIPELLAAAGTRTERMVTARPTTARRARKAPVVQEPMERPLDSIAQLRKAAESCERCPLYKHATQTVFGEGPAHAPVVFVGEQPGDQEDLQGKPFVGPAGKMLDRALEEAGVNRKQIYVTNAVKHFKFEPRGKKRIHAKPNAGEIDRCKWWLGHELTLIRPKLAVALGATAARALLGRATTISRVRGEFLELADHEGTEVFVTVHPSSLLRAPDEETRAREYARFVADMKAIARHIPAVRA